MSLRFLGGALCLATGVLVVSGLCVLILEHDTSRLSPWLDARALSNWLVLCTAAAAGVGCTLLAERSAKPDPAASPTDAPAAGTLVLGAGGGERANVLPAEELPADRLRHAA